MMMQLANKGRFWRALRTLWLLACTLVLVLTLIYRGPEYRDAVEAEVRIMMGFSFPSGWLAFVLLDVLQKLKLFDIGKATELQTILIAWITLFVLGYLQWFVLVPTIVRWWRKKFGNSSSSNISVVPKD
jgi:hypothetical protein